jgi:hypothetical protein
VRVSVEGNAPGEITDKLPEIVRQLLQLDGVAMDDGHAHDHAPLVKAMADADPLEARFTTPAALAMYRAAKRASAARVAALTAAIRTKLEG